MRGGRHARESKVSLGALHAASAEQSGNFETDVARFGVRKMDPAVLGEIMRKDCLVIDKTLEKQQVRVHALWKRRAFQEKSLVNRTIKEGDARLCRLGRGFALSNHMLRKMGFNRWDLHVSFAQLFFFRASARKLNGD